MIALITPTGRRRDQIKLCETWMRNQTYKDDILWVITDDCYPETIKDIGEGYPGNWNIIKVFPTPKWSGNITQGRNISVSLDVVEKFDDVTAVFIIEDDDYYAPVYLEEMIKRLIGYKVTGELYTIYYNVVTRTWFRNRNNTHVSLFQLAFTPDLISLFRKSLHTKFIDMEFFRLLYESKYEKDINLFKDCDYSTGIKGMPGRRGIGAGHSKRSGGMDDKDLVTLNKFIGDDAELYERFYINYRGTRDGRTDKKGIRERPQIPPKRKDDNRRRFEPWK